MQPTSPAQFKPSRHTQPAACEKALGTFGCTLRTPTLLAQPTRVVSPAVTGA